MRSSTRRCAAAAALVMAAACGAERAAETTAPPDSYTVRGEIRALPSAGGREILIRHESIPALKDAGGKVVGMESMTMPFALAESVDRAGLAVGDRIEFVLEIRWDADHPATVAQITELAPGTRLAFDPPQPEGETPR